MSANTIVLSTPVIYEKEAVLVAGKDVTPGMLLEFADAKVQPHSNASAIPSPKIVAVEAPWRSGSGIDDAYDQDGEAVQYQYLYAGLQFNALLAPGEQVDDLDDRLGSDGAGGLQIATTYAFLRPLELVDNSGNSSGYLRIRVEVL